MKRSLFLQKSVLYAFACYLSLTGVLAALLRGDARPASGGVSVRVPVLMYHSILKDPARQGKYIVSPDVLEQDLLYLRAHGYESVTAAELIAFVDSGAPLPERPVLITFDDGHYNNLTYVLPLLEKTGCKAIVSVVGAYCDRYSDAPDPNPNYAYLSWDEVRQLAESGVVEIGSHSYDMHAQGARNGAGRRAGESAAAYEAAFLEDARRMQTLLLTRAGVRASVYAYPYGIIEKESNALLTKLGVRCTFSCNERISVVLQGRPETLLSLGRFNRPAGISTEDFMLQVLGNLR